MTLKPITLAMMVIDLLVMKQFFVARKEYGNQLLQFVMVIILFTRSKKLVDEAALRELKGSDSEGSAILAILALILVGVLLFAVVKISRPTSTALSDKSPVIYATPSVPMAGDSVVYYASCAAVTQLEMPPHLLSLQHLPNGNIHVTIPAGKLS